jgi:hypothetical protein
MNPGLGTKTRRARRSSTFRYGAEDPPRRPPHQASVRRRPRGRGACPAAPTAATRRQIDAAHPARGRRLKTRAPHRRDGAAKPPPPPSSAAARACPPAASGGGKVEGGVGGGARVWPPCRLLGRRREGERSTTEFSTILY